MNDKICVSKDYFYLIIIIFAIFIYIHYSQNLNEEKDINNQTSEEDKKSEEKLRSELISKKYNELLNKIESTMEMQEELNDNLKSKKNDDYVGDVLINRDRKVLEDDFVAPERRLPRHAYPNRALKQLINIPTRGYPDNYQNVGILVRKEDEKILKLFGRQTYPGSNQYEYYVIDSSSNSENKVPLCIPGNKEIYDQDVIPISWLDQSKGLFEAKIYDYNAPKYNPYVI